jgi:hypothetical protein
MNPLSSFFYRVQHHRGISQQFRIIAIFSSPHVYHIRFITFTRTSWKQGIWDLGTKGKER